MHYFRTACDLDWDDDLTLENSDPIRGQLQLAMYALHLASGEGITCRQLKLATIKAYVFSVATFLALFCGRDLRKDNPGDKHFGRYLAPVFRDLEKYETIPNRREPYTVEMHGELERMTVSLRDVAPCSLPITLADWFTVGLLGGFRLAEWANHGGCSNPQYPGQNHLASPTITTRAFVPSDIRILTINNRRYTGLDILKVPLDQIRKVWIKLRTQKNGQHGEERMWTRNINPGGHCMATALYSILARFRALCATNSSLDPVTTPLSVFWDPRCQSVALVTSHEIETFMRAIASQVYGLHPIKNRKELQLWSSHSLRVGACVLLHAMGFSTLDIQWILRLRSVAFMSYLRNLAVLADRQNVAIDRAKGMPHLF